VRGWFFCGELCGAFGQETARFSTPTNGHLSQLFFRLNCTCGRLIEGLELADVSWTDAGENLEAKALRRYGREVVSLPMADCVALTTVTHASFCHASMR
jgi:hypothetical protein